MKKRMVLLRILTCLLLTSLICGNALALEIPRGTTEVKIPVVLKVSAPVAGVQMAFEYSSGLTFISYEKSAAVVVSSTLPETEKGGVTYAGFYASVNNYAPVAGELNIGYLVFEYAGDAPQTVTVREVKLDTVISKDEVSSDVRSTPTIISVTRAPAPTEPIVPIGPTGDGPSTSNNNVIVIEENEAPLTGEGFTGFTDMGGAEWAVEAINYMAQYKCILGIGDGKFDPNGSVTRAQFSRFISQAFGLQKGSAAQSFTDVQSGSWYYEDVMILATNDLIKGYGDGRFGPNDIIMREQMAAIIMRVLEFTKSDVIEKRAFDLIDLNNAGEYARESITILYRAEIINGVGGERYSPKAAATRAQSCVIIYNALKKFGMSS